MKILSNERKENLKLVVRLSIIYRGQDQYDFSFDIILSRCWLRMWWGKKERKLITPSLQTFNLIGFY